MKLYSSPSVRQLHNYKGKSSLHGGVQVERGEGDHEGGGGQGGGGHQAGRRPGQGE